MWVVHLLNEKTNDFDVVSVHQDYEDAMKRVVIQQRAGKPVRCHEARTVFVDDGGQTTWIR